jgi:hypothetical protein
MAKITRKYLKVFGLSGASSDFAVFGSQEAGSPVKSKDIETIQGLAAWDDGWADAIVDANNAPYMEDMNAVMLVFGYQMGYLLQEGIPEYDDGTTYFIGSIVKKTGTLELYSSLTNTNLNNALGSKADTTYWKYLVDLATINAATLGGHDSAYHLARANHTGTQAIATLSDHNQAAHNSLNITPGNSTVTSAKFSGSLALTGYVTKPASALARVYMSADQEPGISPAKLTFDSLTLDVANNYSGANRRFVCPVAGYYRIHAQVIVGGFANQYLFIYVNGGAGAYAQKQVDDGYATHYASIVLQDVYHCTTPGDYIEIWGQYGRFKGGATVSWAIFELIA